MTDPTGQLPDFAPGGVIAGLIAALTAVVAGWAEVIRRKKLREAGPSQLDRIEEMLTILTKTLVVATEDGGRITVSRQLAQGLHARLDAIEKQLARRTIARGADYEKLNELCRNVESLSAAVMSAVDIMQERRRDGAARGER